ncbi:carboxypeptidase regulatory-like domain-containing protein [Paenibacillus chibensis]|uniref:carboxypeptidase regulatory-like domain-containing protein n=1 Tax=Paenibacillus chibensis TaxID=59846 RepID=UPI000FD71458|nr:carboxypeptidase regulatory-like domain-containing protein [Paenibacillus chibensis]MEC0372008.1 carboxypeptidase regulatory-like domain-containing protein [Paenibacillus chibensis]
MRKVSQLSIVAALAVSLAGCGSGKEAPDAKLTLDQTSFPVKQWNMDYSHTVPVKGKLLVGDKPVESAEVKVGSNNHTVTTGKDGSFELLVDQSLISTVNIKVASIDKAKVDGKEIGEKESEKLLNTEIPLHVYYPLQIQNTTVNAKDSSKVDVHVKAQLKPGEKWPVIHEDKYSIHGVVMGADNKPAENAVVWITRDGGEGFAKSTPADKDGKFNMYYIPEDDEEINLEVGYNGVKYTLPPDKVYFFPDETSIETDIILPKEGTVIRDEPPTLVSKEAPGALYTGIMVGLDVGDDVKYEVTIPDEEGEFTLTIPKEAWDKWPTFYETNFSRFIEKELKPGDTMTSDQLQKPAAKDPTHIKAETPKA